MLAPLSFFLLVTEGPFCSDLGFPGGTCDKTLACPRGRHRRQGSFPGLGRSPGGGHDSPLQCSQLENPTDRGAWRLQSIGSQRVGHDWSDLAHAARVRFQTTYPPVPQVVGLCYIHIYSRSDLESPGCLVWKALLHIRSHLKSFRVGTALSPLGLSFTRACRLVKSHAIKGYSHSPVCAGHTVSLALLLPAYN